MNGDVMGPSKRIMRGKDAGLQRPVAGDLVDFYVEEEPDDDLIKRRVAPFRTAYAAQLPKGGD